MPATVITVTSGKGGVGKTTTTAAFGAALASRGKRVCLVDFDVGLRNLDLVLGIEKRVVFDFLHVASGSAAWPAWRASRRRVAIPRRPCL